MNSLRSLALKSEGQSALDSRRLSRELSELGTTDPGRDSASGEATIMEDPTLVMGLLNIAGGLFWVLGHGSAMRGQLGLQWLQ